MSVQGGIWNFNGALIDRGLFQKFSDSLIAKGPDGEFSYIKSSIALVYRPFHTTRKSRRETQPYITERGFILTWDGRLDNQEDFIAELPGVRSGQTDVAIVAAAFDRWETDCFRRIVGDWAVSIWRPEERELIFASDYMAIRHIFYYLKEDQIWWSTDLAPLVLLCSDKFHIDNDYISGYFAIDPESHLTPYREIREVPAGHFVCVRERKVWSERYWRFSPKSCIRYKKDAEYEEHFRHVFRQAVRRRLRADSPVLAELSGGLDSSSIVCMADDILSSEGAETPRLDTLSYYDKAEPNGDDWIYFPKVEEKRARIGVHVDASELARFPDSLKLSEFASLPGNLGAGRMLDVERAAAVRDGGYRVVLSGNGGDEFMGGVPDPREQLADLIVQFKWGRLAEQLIAWSLVKRRPWIHLLAQAVVTLWPPSVRQYFTKRAKVEPWIAKDFAKRTKMGILQLDVEDHFGFQLPTRRSCIGGVLLMANKMSKHLASAVSIEEQRYPYLDQTLIQFILSIPASQMLRPGERRSLMRRSLVGIVPQEILCRRTKQTVARTPLIALEKNLKELHAAFQTALSTDFGYVNQRCFLEKIAAARHGEKIHIVRMTKTISLEFWLRDLVSRDLIFRPKPSRLPFFSTNVELHPRIQERTSIGRTTP